MKIENKKKKGVIYTSGGISHSEDSFRDLVENALPQISKMVNVEERLKFIREQFEKKKIKNK